MAVKIHSQGFKELGALFKDLPAKVEEQVLATGVIAGARVLAKAAKKDAPRSTEKLSPKNAALHARYGSLRQAIKAKLLKKKIKNKRSAIVTRGGAFWGDYLNRGTRYIAATRWYDAVEAQNYREALDVMKTYMVAKVTQLSLKAINQHGANKK